MQEARNWGRGHVANFLSALRDYFDERNRVWLTGDMESLRKTGRVDTGRGWWKQSAASIERKRAAALWRKSEVLRAHTRIHLRRVLEENSKLVIRAVVDEEVTWVCRDGLDYAVESRTIHHLQRWKLVDDTWRLDKAVESDEVQRSPMEEAPSEFNASTRFAMQMDTSVVSSQQYDRVRALRYSELWWNGWNPAYVRLVEDCTNFVSQCLYAGRLPMKPALDRASGWWFHRGPEGKENNWSFSWTTSHGLYRFLMNQVGATRIHSAQELKVGDVILYDWSGQGTFHHSAIVSDFDHRGDPLVNAHSDSSWHRHYLYLDSRAWTAQTRYAFLHLPDVVH